MGPTRSSDDDKYLISEQPGRFVLFGGVLLAITLGLILRGLMAPSKVRPMIESAAQRVHKDIQVQFEGAQISLARGLLPRFAVIVSKVKMASENECWMRPELMADEIRLPVSFWALLRGQNPITKVEAGQVTVRLRSPYKNCEDRPDEPAHKAPQIKQFVTLKNGPGPATKASAPPQVGAILVDQLKIHAPTLAEPLDLNSFALRLKSNSPRVVEMTAKTHLMKDESVGDYLSHATVWGEYSEFPQRTLQGRLSGNWREGSYNLGANYGMKDDALVTELDLKHIPLSQVFQVLKKFQWLKEDLNGRQVWVSLNAQAQIKKSDFKSAEMQIKDVRLEGDVGDVNIENAHVVSLNPLTYLPFSVDIRRMNVEKLLNVLNRAHPTPVLGQLGSFTGVAEVTSQNQVEIRGVHRGLEFIFSNKGQREVQTLNEMAAKLKLDRDRWQIEVSQILPKQGVLDGTLVVNADKDFRSFDLKAKANEVRLSPAVVRLMTAGGQLGPLSGDLSLKYERGGLGALRGTLNSEFLKAEGVSLAKARFSLDYGNGGFHGQTQIQKAAIEVGTPAFQTLKDLIDPEWMNEGRLQMKSLSAQFNAKSFKAVSWKNMSALMEKGGRLSSDGEWSEEGDLSGQVVTQSGKLTRKWVLEGQRDEPVFTPVDIAKKKKQ